MTGRLSGKVAIITGSAGPTGGSIALRLAQEGAHVVLNAHRGIERAEQIGREIEAFGQRALVVKADVSTRTGATLLVDECFRAFNQVDVLVNNAGAMRGGHFVELSEEDIDFAWNTNLRAAFYCAQRAAEYMIARRFGRIINISSIAASGSLFNANYAVAKAGIEGLTRTLALELGRSNITANCVSPGLIESEKTLRMPPAIFQNMIKPSAMRVAVESIDVANAALFFASDEARYVTGQVLHVSGGLDITVNGMQEA